MNLGSRVRFKAHGETGLVHTLVTREGDDCAVQDPRGRILFHVPIELLEAAQDDTPIVLAVPGKAWRGVDELEV